MIRQMYAPLVFASLNDMESIVQESKLQTSYELARAGIPRQTLQMRSVGKFHFLGDAQPKAETGYLAQIEMVDLPQDDILITPFRQQLGDKGYGRISVVGHGNMSYDLAEQASLLSEVEDFMSSLQPTIKSLEDPASGLSVKDLMIKLVTLQNKIHRLSDMRTENGFSAGDNAVYSQLTLFCYTFSLAIQQYMANSGNRFPYEISDRAMRLFQGVQALGYLELKREAESPNGINKPVYFTPRLKVEDVALVF